jgi:A/G-specific adenine glycosylase
MEFFNSSIHAWYALSKRDLPWRNTKEPYPIWLSEIILQQTRIDQGLAYYLKFIEEFPSISDLAGASEDHILKLWQGLGYYSRARNLHFTAKYIHQNLDGKFPEDYKSILSLKGVGAYTAAAIASISFNMEYPAIDGNVYRVLSRFFGISESIDSVAGKNGFKKLAKELIRGTDPGMHNQALMEFGALQCTPKNPNCQNCPLKEKCFAYLSKKVGELPYKEKKTKQRDRYFNYLVINYGDHLWIQKRSGNDIWKNLFEFPLIEMNEETSIQNLSELPEFQVLAPKESSVIKNVGNWKIHILSHQRIHYRIIRIQLESEINLSTRLIRVNKRDIFNFAVPKLLENYINEPGHDGLFI